MSLIRFRSFKAFAFLIWSPGHADNDYVPPRLVPSLFLISMYFLFVFRFVWELLVFFAWLLFSCLAVELVGGDYWILINFSGPLFLPGLYPLVLYQASSWNLFSWAIVSLLCALLVCPPCSRNHFGLYHFVVITANYGIISVWKAFQDHPPITSISY